MSEDLAQYRVKNVHLPEFKAMMERQRFAPRRGYTKFKIATSEEISLPAVSPRNGGGILMNSTNLHFAHDSSKSLIDERSPK